MTRKTWTTDPQREWLEARLAEFREAQQTKTSTTIFFPQTQKRFKDKWPRALEPTDEEIAEADGSIEKAIGNKSKLLNNVSIKSSNVRVTRAPKAHSCLAYPELV